jgi:hypothetical protein
MPPSGSADRRLRLSRIVAAMLVLVAGASLAYFTMFDRSAAPPPVEEAPKDVAAQFETIQGNVKTRGVGGLDWRSAAASVPLRKSDLVRTYPSSSAEIKFFDETRVTVRPDSLITIEETTRDPNSTTSRVAWKVTSGEINYETAQRGAGSTEAVTPTFRLAIEGNSAGTMRVSETGLTALAQLSGSANVETKTGEKIRLGANEGLRVDATGKAGAKQTLPDMPVPQPPGVNGVVSVREGAPVSVSWPASKGASAYRVQVETKTPSGRESLLDRDGVAAGPVVVPGITSGDFFFRVAGLTQDGVQGRFSPWVPFKVERTAAPTPDVDVAVARPMLTIESFEARANVVRLTGKTEPGAKLTVNGEAIAVAPDGSFNTFVTLARKQGEQRVVIRATSSSGGIAEETRTVTAGQ